VNVTAIGIFDIFILLLCPAARPQNSLRMPRGRCVDGVISAITASGVVYNQPAVEPVQ